MSTSDGIIKGFEIKIVKKINTKRIIAILLSENILKRLEFRLLCVVFKRNSDSTMYYKQNMADMSKSVEGI